MAGFQPDERASLGDRILHIIYLALLPFLVGLSAMLADMIRRAGRKDTQAPRDPGDGIEPK